VWVWWHYRPLSAHREMASVVASKVFPAWPLETSKRIPYSLETWRWMSFLSTSSMPKNWRKDCFIYSTFSVESTRYYLLMNLPRNLKEGTTAPSQDSSRKWEINQILSPLGKSHILSTPTERKYLKLPQMIINNKTIKKM
jgi:hypothetical protein